MEAISRGIAAVTPPSAPLKDVFYQFDSVELAPEAQEILQKNAEWLKANPKVRVEVEGHCDDIGAADIISPSAPNAPVAGNFSLATTSRSAVTISYGKEAPLASNTTKSAASKPPRPLRHLTECRRVVDFWIVSPEAPSAA
jgi:peptidoglycan-associated lipoprotein